jgi:hypothetical protein
MAKKRSNKEPYLTKRILVSAARAGGREAAKNAMDIMGYVVVVKNGWIVRKYPDGTIEKLERLESTENTKLVLD